LALILPIAVAVFLLSEEIISFLYLRGNVTPSLAHAAAISLRALILAMPAYGLTELFSRVCYSAGKVRFPMISSLTGIAVTALMGAIFLRAGALSVATVALAASLGQIAAALILFILCFLYFPGVRTVLSLPKLAAIAAGTLLSGCAMTVLKRILKQFLNFSHTFENFMTITIVFTVGIVVYLLWLVIIKPVFADMLRQTMRKGGNSVYEQK
jgi:peptidoglycan biosynthesis protein MviN/MurJ (putative lipid II flippase)